MKQFKTFHTFHKAVRKYWKRHAKLSIFRWRGYRCVSYWTGDEWCYYTITNPSELDNPIVQCKYLSYDIHPDDDFDATIASWKPLIGKKVQLLCRIDEPDIIGTFYIVLINNGAKFGIKKDDGKLYTYPFLYTVKEIK